MTTTEATATNFDLTEEQQQVQQAAREFARDAVAPLAQELDENAEFPVDNYKQMAELGFLGLSIPEEAGGSGFDTLSFILVVEELSKVCGSTGLG